MNNYNTDQIVLSSDNSSDSDDSMNDTELSKTNGILQKNINFYAKGTQYRNNHFKSTRGAVLATKYKKKSIAWFNNKTQRENYKQILEIFKKQNQKILNIPHPLHSGEIKNINNDYNLLDQMKSKTGKIENAIRNDIATTIDADATTITAGSSVKNIEPIFNNLNSCDVKNNKKKNMETEFHREVNCLYTQHENVVSNYLKDEQPKSIIEEQITRISQDINALNQMLKTKEKEWNRILYHRNLKTEVFERLNRLKKALLLKKQISNKTLPELKELEAFLFEAKTTKLFTKRKSASNSAFEILERRANMKKEDLLKEHIDYSYIERLLAVPKNDDCTDQLTTKISFKKPQSKKYKCENKIPFANYKFPPKNIKLDDEKHKSMKKNDNNITTKNDNNITTKNEKEYRLYNKKVTNFPTDEKKIVKVMNEKLPLCDHCKLSKSQIVCAGCGQQWYCNKKCQISAWKKHHQRCNMNSIHQYHPSLQKS